MKVVALCKHTKKGHTQYLEVEGLNSSKVSNVIQASGRNALESLVRCFLRDKLPKDWSPVEVWQDGSKHLEWQFVS